MPIKDLSSTDGASQAEDKWGETFAVGKEFGDTLPPEALQDGGAPPEGDAGSSTAASDGSAVAPPTTPIGDVAAGEGKAPVVDAGTTPVVEATPPTDGTVEPPKEIDPVPFTYIVDEKEESLEGAMYLPGDGLYIPDAQVPHAKLVFSQAKTLDRQVRELRDKSSLAERQWDRLTTHKVRTTDGKEETLSGVRGLEALRVSDLTNDVSVKTLVAALNDPDQFERLVDYVKLDARGQPIPEHLTDETDGVWKPVLHKGGYQELIKLNSIAIRERKLALRDQLDELKRPVAPEDPPAESFAAATISSLAQQNSFSALNAQDKEFLTAHFSAYIRPSTPAERAQHGFPFVVQPGFVELMKDRNAIREEIAKVAKDATASAIKKTEVGTKITTFNAGMQQGRKLVPAATTTTTAQPAREPATGRFAPKTKDTQSPDDMWATVIQEAVSTAG